MERRVSLSAESRMSDALKLYLPAAERDWRPTGVVSFRKGSWTSYVLGSAEGDTSNSRDVLQAELSNGLSGLLLVTGVNGDSGAAGDGGLLSSLRLGAAARIFDVRLGDFLVGELFDSRVGHFVIRTSLKCCVKRSLALRTVQLYN